MKQKSLYCICIWLNCENDCCIWYLGAAKLMVKANGAKEADAASTLPGFFISCIVHLFQIQLRL